MGSSKLTEVKPAEKPSRRRFSAEEKLRILDEIDNSSEQIGMILRREGIYSSHLVQWRRWRLKMGEGGAKVMHNENAKLKREVARLEMKLKKAEVIIDLQKKIAELIHLEQVSEKSENACLI